MAYWNRYDEEDDQNRDFESGNRYNRGGFSRDQDPSQRGSWHSSQERGERESERRYERARQWQRGHSGRDQDRSQGSQFDEYDSFGSRLTGRSGENYQSWGNEDRDWDYGFPRDYDQNRDYRRDYQQDYDTYRDRYSQNRQRGRQDYGQNRDNRQDYRYSDQHQGNTDRGRYERDQYNRYNVSGYNDEEEYYGLGYRPTNYNPHHPDRMPGREIPVAGMQSDYGGNTDYDNPNSGRSVYQRGDIGFENEGAFYQDMDEPVNSETFPSREGRGRHYGKGPTNYRRSDSRIQEYICERLTRHGRINATDIDVTVDNGVAILKGTVPTRDMKRLAEDVADDITGVKDVENEIKVNRQQSWDRGNRYTQGDYQRGGGHSGRQSGQLSGQRYASQSTIGGTPAINPDRDFEDRAEHSPAGQSNVGAGLTDAGATSLEGMAAAENTEENKHGLREGMEVIGRNGKVLGRVKEIREGDFLLDRELARDLYVPYSALQSVGAQAMLNIQPEDIDKQGWDKPSIV